MPLFFIVLLLGLHHSRPLAAMHVSKSQPSPTWTMSQASVGSWAECISEIRLRVTHLTCAPTTSQPMSRVEARQSCPWVPEAKGQVMNIALPMLLVSQANEAFPWLTSQPIFPHLTTGTLLSISGICTLFWVGSSFILRLGTLDSFQETTLFKIR